MIVVDTHVWLWWIAAPERLSRPAARALQRATQTGISAITLWEAALLGQHERVKTTGTLESWLRQALAMHPVDVVSLSVPVVTRAAQLGSRLHGDPSDRLIVATALVEGASLVTKDQRIHDSKLVDVIW